LDLDSAESSVETAAEGAEALNSTGESRTELRRTASQSKRNVELTTISSSSLRRPNDSSTQSLSSSSYSQRSSIYFRDLPFTSTFTSSQTCLPRSHLSAHSVGSSHAQRHPFDHPSQRRRFFPRTASHLGTSLHNHQQLTNPVSLLLPRYSKLHHPHDRDSCRGTSRSPQAVRRGRQDEEGR